MQGTLIVRACAILAFVAASGLLSFDARHAVSVTAAVAQDARPADKEAFEAAKELGTADAWNAFLASYPTGFYADLARAYLKKGGEQTGTPTATSAPVTADNPPAKSVQPSSARAAERPCSQRTVMRSEHSREPTKITFVNRSGMYRGILWFDFKGQLKDYGGLNSGEQLTLDTFRTHPWMISTGPGDCLQIFLPAAEPAVVELVRQPADDGPIKPPATTKGTQAPKAAAPPLVCARNYVLQNGRCVLVQNCGANAVRNPEGDCHCQRGYVSQGGKCVWPTNKQGFEVAPWTKPGCSTLQSQCRQGNRTSCTKYEETCQVN